MWQFFKEIVKNHELVWALAMKDLRIRYKRSVLGFMWGLLNPLMMMVIFTVVFSAIARTMAVHNYAIFLISMLLPWTFFVQSLSYAVESIVSNGELLKKVKVAKSVFPAASIIANLINFLLSLVPLVFLLAVLRFPFFWTWLYLPVCLLGLVLFTLGCGFFFAAANVYFRDMSHILQILLTGWFYLSPIMYPFEFLPSRYRLFFRFNPMLYILNGFRLSIYYGQLPSLKSTAISLVIGATALIFGYSFFRRLEDRFVFYV